jgi:hypothetical protein
LASSFKDSQTPEAIPRWSNYPSGTFHSKWLDGLISKRIDNRTRIPFLKTKNKASNPKGEKTGAKKTCS